MLHNGKASYFLNIIRKQQPDALATVRGSENFPNICGTVKFYKNTMGILVVSEINCLPHGDTKCSQRIFAMHIHEGQSCTGNKGDQFANVGGHYNPNKCDHPMHAGDLPPLFENGGYAFGVVLTDRFCINEIIGRTVIIHDMPDDFTSQPSGNSGEKIACGVICSL